jgi:hypothetical protein
MSEFNRRNFIKNSLSLGAAGLAPSLLSACSGINKRDSNSIGTVLIIGGGYAGSTAAKYISMWSAGSIEVVMIERCNLFQ